MARVFQVPQTNLVHQISATNRSYQVSQVPQIGLKEECRVLKVRKRRLKAEVRCLGKLLIESGERRVGALAVLTRIQAQRLVGLVHAQAAVE